MERTTMEQRGEYRTRGAYGERVTRLHRVTWDPEAGGWRRASDADPDEACCWGAWDSTYGWMAPWEPEEDEATR
jgi:hypothetical protein